MNHLPRAFTDKLSASVRRAHLKAWDSTVDALERDHTQHKAQVLSLSQRIEDIARRLGQ